MRNKKGIHAVLKRWHGFRLQLFFEGIATGLLAGIVVVAFRLLLENAETFREKIFAVLRAAGPGPVILEFLSLMFIAYLLGAIKQIEPMSGGSGIPQVKGILFGHLKMNWLKVAATKFFGGILAIGAGLSLGREGPSVQLGASMGQGVSRLLGRLRIEEKYLITSGASAGLSAAFNAPLAGVVFALEELHKNFSPVVLTSAMAASITADFVTRQFFGQRPVFDFQNLPVFPLSYYIYLVGLGIAIGAFGAFFNWFLFKTIRFYEKLPFISEKMKPVLPLLIGGILGFILPEVLGGGNRLIDQLQAGHYGLTILVVLLLAKFLFTMFSYGSGVPGGIFMPLLVIGALAGGVYGHIVMMYIHISPLYMNNFIVFAMAAYFSAIVKAPVTGSILIMEMTGSFSHLLPLITISMVSYICSDVLKARPVYDLLLERILEKRAQVNSAAPPKNKMIIEIAITIESVVCNKKIKDIPWPENLLLVGIRRGDSEIIPRGDTRICAGDCLIALTGEDKSAQMREQLQSIVTGSKL